MRMTTVVSHQCPSTSVLIPVCSHGGNLRTHQRLIFVDPGSPKQRDSSTAWCPHGYIPSHLYRYSGVHQIVRSSVTLADKH